jgi:hypothetical protein
VWGHSGDELWKSLFGHEQPLSRSAQSRTSASCVVSTCLAIFGRFAARGSGREEFPRILALLISDEFAKREEKKFSTRLGRALIRMLFDQIHCFSTFLGARHCQRSLSPEILCGAVRAILQKPF